MQMQKVKKVVNMIDVEELSSSGRLLRGNLQIKMKLDIETIILNE